MNEWKQEIRQRLSGLKLDPTREAEIVEELSQHLDDRYAELRSGGATKEHAIRLALIELSDSRLLARELRRVERLIKSDPVVLGSRRQNVIAGIWQDLRFGARMLRKNSGFTLIAVLTLGLAIGANTAIFSVLNGALLRPLPVREPEQLVGLYRKIPQDENFNHFSFPNYLDTRDRSESFTGLAAYYFTPFNLSSNNETERISGKVVTGNYFEVLGVEPAAGRWFLPDEDRTPDTHPVAVIGHGLWQRRFGGDPGLVGRTITLNGYSFTVIGITPKGFQGAELGMIPDVFVPLMMQRRAMPGSDWLNGRMIGWLRVLGRLKPEVSVAQARAELQAIGEQLQKEHPSANEMFGIALIEDFAIHPQFRSLARNFLLVLMAVVGLVMLIACSNVAGLLLARAAERQQEIGIRLALGAARGRLIGQLLIESLLLAFLGGAVGLALAPLLTRALGSIQQSGGLPSPVDFPIDQRVLGFTLLLSLLTGVVFGLAPALSASRPDLMKIIKGGPAEGKTGRTRLRSFFVAAQMALSLVLLVTAGLFIRSLQNAQRIDVGFKTEQQLLLAFDLSMQGYSRERGEAFSRQLEQRVTSLPGVQSVALASSLPLGRGSDQDTAISIDGYTPPSGLKTIPITYNNVGAGYLQTMGIPLLRGRNFTGEDIRQGPSVVIINEAAARRFWPGQEALGKRVRFAKDEAAEVIGVARDCKYVTLGEDPLPFLYSPLTQSNPADALVLHVRTAGDPLAFAGAVTDELHALDKDLPVFDVKTMQQHLRGALLAPRLAAVVLAIFGLVALLLSAIGVYGVIAQQVNQRTREIGVRIALGASSGDVLKLIIGRGLKLTLYGLVPGMMAALAVTRLIEGFLYDVSATDPLVFAAITLLLAGVALLASYVPANRAIKVEPISALRHE
ncbi:MAG TPA: ABC transporter permease [Blastocatellia bacterium]|nr:ABC transporter permease [Blastocatellia bacterium]